LNKTAALGVILASMLVFGSSANAQTSEIEVARSAMATEKKAIVAKNLPMTEDEAQAFWPVYNDYQLKLRKVNDRMGALIKKFATEYETLTDEQAIDLIKENQKIRDERLGLAKKNLKQFQNVLPGKKVARYYQMESKLQASLDYELAKAIPLVE